MKRNPDREFDEFSYGKYITTKAGAVMSYLFPNFDSAFRAVRLQEEASLALAASWKEENPHLTPNSLTSRHRQEYRKLRKAIKKGIRNGWEYSAIEYAALARMAVMYSTHSKGKTKGIG
jgi:hypothetical protein